ncbi:MAG: prolyl oligopeptidase, partial [Flavobacterium sp.]
MKKTITLAIVALSVLSCKQEPKAKPELDMTVNYPETKKADSVDVYFGDSIQDPYRWLEDDNSEETKAWVKAQNVVTFGYLDKIPFRKQIKERLEKLWNYEKISAPFKEGDYTYFY